MNRKKTEQYYQAKLINLLDRSDVIEMYHRKIIEKLNSEGLGLQSDWHEIEACFLKTVMPVKNVQTVWELKYGKI